MRWRSILNTPMLKNVVVPLLVGMFATGATFAVGVSGYFNKNREMDIRMLELSLQILREDPTQSQIKAARGWAVDLINHVSPVPIPMEARNQLIDNKLPNWISDDGWYESELHSRGAKTLLKGLLKKSDEPQDKEATTSK